MAYTKLQKQHILRRLGSIQTSPRCPRCDANTWLVEGPVELPYVDRPSRAVPAAAVICDQCGYIDLVSTAVLGVE